MKKKTTKAPDPHYDFGVTWLMKRPKRKLAEQLAALAKKHDAALNQLAEARYKLAEFDSRQAERSANASRLAFLQARHNALEEWANSARRVVFSFPGVTNE